MNCVFVRVDGVQKQWMRRSDFRPVKQTDAARWRLQAFSKDKQKHLHCKSFTELKAKLVSKLMKRQKACTDKQRWLVGIAGVPGSGKTTIARHLAEQLNENSASDSVPMAVVVPMDGFHLYRHELEQFDDPIEAKNRRGAYWTFNAYAFIAALRRLQQNSEDMISLPSFDHGVGDPIENDIHIHKQTQILIIEGNYLLIDIDPWNQICEILNETWYRQCEIDVAMDRVYRRHVSTGKPPDLAARLVKHNDKLNAAFIASYASRADFVFSSDF